LADAKGKGIVVNERPLWPINKNSGEVVAVGKEAKDMLGLTRPHGLIATTLPREPEHVLASLPDSHDLAAVLVDGHNDGSFTTMPLPLRTPMCWLCQVNRQVGRKQAEDRAKAYPFLFMVPQFRTPPAVCGCAYRSAPAGLSAWFSPAALLRNYNFHTLDDCAAPAICPVTAMEWLPPPNDCVKYLNVPSGCISATDSPLMISAAPARCADDLHYVTM